MTLLTPTQIIQQKPSIQNYFSPKQMGYLLWLGLVRGRQVSRTSYLCLEDIEELIEIKAKIK